MALDAVIFDLDGTLLDTNPAHVAAWQQAFTALGYRIPPDRIAFEIGKGGDKLLPAILGEETARDAPATKPDPDLLQAALATLGLSPAQAAMVGDTQFDAEASRQAGVACLGLLSGGTGQTAELLRRAGARGVWRDPQDLLGHL